MTLPITVTFHDTPSREWIEAEILKRAEKLKTFGDVTSCHTIVDVPHHHHAGANGVTVKIDLRVPGGEIAVSRTSSLQKGEHLRQVIREAFDVARRQLQDYARKRRGAVKVHPRASRKRPSAKRRARA